MGARLIGAPTLTRFLGNLLYGVKPTGAETFVVVPVTLVAVSLLACYIPARRGSSQSHGAAEVRIRD